MKFAKRVDLCVCVCVFANTNSFFQSFAGSEGGRLSGKFLKYQKKHKKKKIDNQKPNVNFHRVFLRFAQSLTSSAAGRRRTETRSIFLGLAEKYL